MAETKTGVNPLFLREDELRAGMEMLLCAYRDVMKEADPLLAGRGMGRAHHRVIYFVGRNPGIAVSELTALLGITKQSLARVLAPLVAQGYLEQRPAPADRRKRLLALTRKGQELERQVTERQRASFARAYRRAGAEAVEGFRSVLRGLVSEPVRAARRR